MALIDLRNADMFLVSGGNNIEIKIGEGNLTYTEKREIDAVKSRGLLDTMRQNEDQTMEVSFNFMWEFITSNGTDDLPTIEDVLKGAWASTSSDPDAPRCVDIVINTNPDCPGVDNEVITLPQFNYTQLAHSIRDATIACNGICNSTEAVVVRVAP